MHATCNPSPTRSSVAKAATPVQVPRFAKIRVWLNPGVDPLISTMATLRVAINTYNLFSVYKGLLYDIVLCLRMRIAVKKYLHLHTTQPQTEIWAYRLREAWLMGVAI